jgi:site-specific recombinase XerD
VVRVHEKGGKEHSMPCHHNLETYLQDYIDTAIFASEREGRLFRTAFRRTGILTDRPMTQSDAWRMPRRARDAGIPTAVCNHAFRATGITAYLDNAAHLKTLRPWPLTRALHHQAL